LSSVTHSVISHYRVLHQLGEGGMGVVYRAEDLRLDREVAIKFLRKEDGSHAPWLTRFEREARLASALKHPHICTIHELGEHDGRPFIVMELLEGRTMKQLIERGPLPVVSVIHFGVQIASALEAAHARDIIHRDIKPANLFVNYEDHLKVLDFGLAKLASLSPSPAITATAEAALQTTADVDVTATGAAVGTAAYMSPEQATGAKVDARTDLFSFGSVLYEMSTGRRAFPGDNSGTVIMRLLKGEFIPPRSLNPAIPERLETIILRAMEVDPNRRYQTAGGMLEDLRALERVLAPDASSTSESAAAAKPLSGPGNRRRVWRWSAAAVVLIAALLAGAWRWTRSPFAALALTNKDSIVVGGFANTTGDPVFDETLTTALKVQLGQSPFLDIVPDDRISETLRSMGKPEDERLSHDIGRNVCERLGLKALIDGTIATLGSNYVVTLSATNCQTGEAVGREQGEATSKESVLGTLGPLASTMRTRLGESLPSIKQFDVPIEQATTTSLPALKAYAMGIAERRKGRELESIAFFKQAIELDPDFAAAYTTLSTVYGGVGEFRLSERNAQLAYEKMKRVSERERLFITYQYHDRVTGNQDEAAKSLELWKSAYPRDQRPVNALALIYNRFGAYDRGVTEATEALRRSPGNPFPMSNLAFAYRGLGRYADAKKVADDAVKLGIATTPTRRLLFQVGTLTGDGSAAAQVEWSKSQSREYDIVSARAQVAAFQGKLHEASQLFGQAADMATSRGLSGTASGYWAHLALTEALYGDRKRTPQRVREIVARTASAAESPGTVPRFRAAVALGLVGLTSEAHEIVVTTRKNYPDSTFTRTVLTPAAEAAIALSRGAPTEALDALQGATTTEFGTVAGLVPTFLRGEAYLAKGDAEGARAEYQKVLDHRGADPFAPVVPLARLGMARAWRLSGDAAKSRQEYDELLTIWKDADADLPLLERVRAERASVESSSSSAPAARR
jgi:serine/threonine protein kinase/tetratricopeptide (TPR) repeat protein